MYSRKSVGPKMESLGTQALTGYSFEDFPSRTTWSHILLRKEELPMRPFHILENKTPSDTY